MHEDQHISVRNTTERTNLSDGSHSPAHLRARHGVCESRTSPAPTSWPSTKFATPVCAPSSTTASPNMCRRVSRIAPEIRSGWSARLNALNVQLVTGTGGPSAVGCTAERLKNGADASSSSPYERWGESGTTPGDGEGSVRARSTSRLSFLYGKKGP